MGRSIPKARQIDRVYQLGYFITGERKAALKIAAKAAEGWERTFREQRKRPRSKTHPEKLRQKLIMNDEHALQCLTYKLCEPEEKAQERNRQDGASSLHPHFFIIRYVKHLLYKTVPHRSFHVTVGLCRLLYDYPMGDTVKVYNALAQEDYRLEKDDQMYKDWKQSLMTLLERRFTGLLSVEKGPRGARRFVRMAEQGLVAELVMNCLELFTPWNTSCALPTGPKAVGHRFEPFRFTGRHPDEEHPVEERRMHAVINPACFTVLTHALQLGLPCDRLSVPYFNLPQSDNDKLLPPPDSHNLPSLSAGEMFDITDYLNRNKRRRKASHMRKLSVEVEGVERTVIDLEEQRSARLMLEEDDDLIQVFAGDGGEKLLLASLLLSGSGALADDQPWYGSISLPRGEELKVAVIPSRGHTCATAGVVVEIEYKEARPSFGRLMSALTGAWAGLKRGRVLIPATALSLIIAALLLFGPLRPKKKQESHATQASQPEQVIRQGESSRLNNSQPPAANSTGVDGGAPASTDSRQTQDSQPDERGNKRDHPPASGKRVTVPGATQVASLTGVRRVFVSQGRSESERRLRDALVEELRASRRFTVVDSEENADATLVSELARGNTVSVQLVSGARVGLWHKAAQVSGEDPPSIRAAATDIVRSLLDDAEKLERLRGLRPR